jgi:hypothetical protein
MGSRELLEKVVNTTQIGAGNGGIMNAKQANKFIDYVVEQSVLVADARLVRMVEPTQDIDKVNIGSRIMRKASEGVDDGVNVDPTFSKISMTTVKLRLDWELTTEGLEDNIERDSLEDHVASLMARQTANDLEDLLIHGDTTSTDALLKSLDGWRKRVRADGHVVDAAGANLSRSTFDKGLRSLPNKYLQRRNALKWYTSSGLLQDYLWSLMASTLTGDAFGSTAGTAASGAPAPASTLGEAILQGLGGSNGGVNGATGVRPYGIPLWEVPLLEETETGTYSAAAGNHGVVELTFPDNRILGIQRDITVYREFKPKKDAIEYTQFIRIANQIENPDAFVHVRNVKVRAI